MTASDMTEGRMIFKVLIVGNDLPLQTGFLSEASGDRVSCQLYNSVGLSLGVAKFKYPEKLSIILQLWSIPFSERMQGLSRNFTKGHTAIILVLHPHEIARIPELFHRLSLSQRTPLLIVVVGSVRDAEANAYQIDAFLGSQLPIHAVQNIGDVIRIIADNLLPSNSEKNQLPMVVALDSNSCPLYEPAISDLTRRLNSDDEIDEIRLIAIDLGLRIIGDCCAIELDEGVAWVNMKTGSIRMEPGVCKFCTHSCKRYANICIVATDTGWSTMSLGSHALLTIAKIYALTARMLPTHVKKQIERATVCARFDPNPSIPIEDIPEEFLSGLRKTDSGRSLLEAARQRMMEGKLSKDVFSMLKKKLRHLESSRSH